MSLPLLSIRAADLSSLSFSPVPPGVAVGVAVGVGGGSNASVPTRADATVPGQAASIGHAATYGHAATGGILERIAAVQQYYDKGTRASIVPMRMRKMQREI